MSLNKMQIYFFGENKSQVIFFPLNELKISAFNIQIKNKMMRKLDHLYKQLNSI